jgi:hypothetical protein
MCTRGSKIPGMMFDQAICDLVIDQHGKIISKYAVTVYD